MDFVHENYGHLRLNKLLNWCRLQKRNINHHTNPEVDWKLAIVSTPKKYCLSSKLKTAL